jgi:hypothetical protein
VIRAAIARLSSPPADHNLPGLPSLSPEEIVCVEQARAALASAKRTFEFWVALARGLAMLRAKADAVGGSFTFARLREREGFGLHRATVHNLIRLHERLPEVEAWRATLTERERFRWAGPEVILLRCPVFARSRPAQAASPRIEPTASVDATPRFWSACLRLSKPKSSSGPGWPSSRRGPNRRAARAAEIATV